MGWESGANLSTLPFIEVTDRLALKVLKSSVHALLRNVHLCLTCKIIGKVSLVEAVIYSIWF